MQIYLMKKDENLKQEYDKIINDQLASGVIEKAPLSVGSCFGISLSVKHVGL